MSSAGVAWEATAPDQGTERAREFRFDVTWFALSAHLPPLHTAEQIFAPSTEIVLASAMPPAKRKPEVESAPRWEMVVPKMDRTDVKKPAPVPVLLPRATEEPAGRDLSIAKIVSALRGRRKAG
jgi:hypothetical protein